MKRMRNAWRFGRLCETGAFALGALVALVRCSGEGSAEPASAGAYPPGASGGSPRATADAGAGANKSDDAASPQPEQETEATFEAPVATGRFVWSANPKSGQVACIDAESYQVRTAPAGSGPKYLAAIPAREGEPDRAIVLNVYSNDASLFTVREDGSLAKTTIRMAPGANAWAISKDGRWAVAFTDARKVEGANPNNALATISVIDLSEAKNATVYAAKTTVVGYRPVSLSFALADDPANDRAYAVTVDGVSIVELARVDQPDGTRSVGWPLSCMPSESPDGGPDAGLDAGRDAPTEAQAPKDAASEAADAPGDAPYDAGLDAALDAEAGPPADAPNDAGGDGATDGSEPNDAPFDTSLDGEWQGSATAYRAEAGAAPVPVSVAIPDTTVTPDGHYAVVRREGSRDVVLMDLTEPDACSRVSLGGIVTDLDLSQAGDMAVAVVREASELTVLSIPSLAPKTLRVSGQTFGSVALSPNGQRALLYTTAFTNVTTVTAVDLTGDSFSFRTIETHNPVKAAYLTENAAYAFLVHGDASVSAGGFGVVPLGGNQPMNSTALDATLLPGGVALSSTNKGAVAVVSDEGSQSYYAYRAVLPTRVLTRFRLASPPVSVGIMPDGRRAF